MKFSKELEDNSAVYMSNPFDKPKLRWPLDMRLEAVEDGEILLGCNGFLRWGHHSEQIRCYKAFWFEEMKLPELPPAPLP